MSKPIMVQEIEKRIKRTGDTMSGRLYDSTGCCVNGSIAYAGITIPDLIESVRYKSGCMGSFSLTETYTTTNGLTIPGNGAWYNFLYIPHRTGGVNGNAEGDNQNYGNLIIFGMTLDNSYCYVIQYRQGINASHLLWVDGDNVTGAVWN